MTEYEKITIVIASISAGIALLALVWSAMSIRLTNAQVEIDMRNQINAAIHRVEDFGETHGDFMDLDEATLSVADKKRRERLIRILHTRIESYLSVLDGACGKYLDRKIDRRRFQKDYQTEVRNARTAPEHEEYFKPGKYNALKRVFNQWENRETG